VVDLPDLSGAPALAETSVTAHSLFSFEGH